MIEFENPFPVQMPCPIRPHAGEMEPETIHFVGNTIRVKYRKLDEPRGWWDGAAIHEIDWFPELNHPDEVIAHYVKQLPANRRVPKREQKERLREKARFTKCGKGLKVKLSPEMAGLNVAGGRDAIYLISENGTAGALRLWSSKYQSYPLSGFRIESVGE